MTDPKHTNTDPLDEILNELYHNRPPYSFRDDEINDAIEWQEGAVNEAEQAILEWRDKAVVEARKETESELYVYMTAGQRQDYRNHRDATFQNDPRVALKETPNED
jgi:hypothetical protein